MSRSRSLSRGATEADLPPLSRIPPMDAPLAEIERYFQDYVADYNSALKEEGSDNVNDDPSFPHLLRCKLRAERMMANKEFLERKDGIFLAVDNEHGLVGFAPSIFELHAKLVSGATESAPLDLFPYCFCLRQQFYSISSAVISQPFPQAGGPTRTAYFNVLFTDTTVGNPRNRVLLFDPGSDQCFQNGGLVSHANNPSTGFVDFKFTVGVSRRLGRLIYITLDGLRTRVSIYKGDANILGLDVIHRYTGTFNFALNNAVTMIAKPNEANHL